MKQSSKYEIPFSGLSSGKHEFDWTLERDFFAQSSAEDITESELKVSVLMSKNDRMLNLNFDISGRVKTICDHCGDDFWLNVDSSEELIAKFGAETDLTGDEVVYLGPSEHKIDIRQFIYEFTLLSLPVKKVHEPGDCNEAVEQFFTEAEQKETTEQENDPRWKALETLKNKN